jgi:hypothetical protein
MLSYLEGGVMNKFGNCTMPILMRAICAAAIKPLQDADVTALPCTYPMALEADSLLLKCQTLPNLVSNMI